MKKICLALLACSLGVVNAQDICAPNQSRDDIKQAVKWYRNSAEQIALYHQAFGVGYQYIDNWVTENKPKPKTWGIVLDIDETTLDNSWYFKACNDLASNESDFSHYVAISEKSTALPGVKNLVEHVHQLGGYVTLVSNRDGSYEDSSGSVMKSTSNNLTAEGIYFDQILLANDKGSTIPSDKNYRFNATITGAYLESQMVWSNKLPPHTVIAFFGDNIQDFPKLKQKNLYGVDKNDTVYNKFGNGFFILPNPMYGSWEHNLAN